MRTRHDRILDLSERRLALGVEAGIIHRRIEDESLDGGTITIDGQQLAYFGSCAYLALNRDDRLKAAAIDATRRYGTSYSSSPTYTALPLYDTLEERLRRMTGGAVAVAQTTTLAHIAALPIMVAPEDLVLVDAQTHDSVQPRNADPKGRGCTGGVGTPQRRAQRSSGGWPNSPATFATCGTSPTGCTRCTGTLHPSRKSPHCRIAIENLYTYYDDAHGFGWQGETGRGYVLSETPINDRMVVSAGFAKSFGSVGAVLVFGDAGMAKRVRMVGGPLTFSGPIPPPDLGAATSPHGSTCRRITPNDRLTPRRHRVGPFGDRASRTCRWPRLRQARSGSFGWGLRRRRSS